jgi:hypothetical protein
MGSGRSQVRFRNSTDSTIWVAYMRLDWGCDEECGDPWDVLGWVRLEPGLWKYRSNPTSNRWFYYYAESNDGSFWSGNYLAEVSNDAFSKCTCLGVAVSHGPQPYYDVGMRQLDTKTYIGVNFT